MSVNTTNAYTLRKLRLINDLTQKEAGEKVGVSENTWFNWENARSFPNVPQLKRIEKEFGVTYDDIIFLIKDNG